MSAVHWLSVRQSFSVLMLFVTSVFYWTANYLYKDTSARSSARFSHLRRLRQIRNCVSREVMAQLVMSLVISLLDYCNSMLCGLPASSLVPLQRVQNVAARLVLNLDRQSHITSALQQLHWLPVKFRIIFKNHMQGWCTKSSTTAVRRISPTWSSSTRRTNNNVSSSRH